VIYSGDNPPELLDGEEDIILKREPVKVKLYSNVGELRPTSRLNLAKLYTIEHNIPNLPVGKLSSRDIERVRNYCVEVQGFLFSAGSTSQSLDEVDEEEDEEDG
jgi:uncharacterized protein DUF6590